MKQLSPVVWVCLVVLVAGLAGGLLRAEPAATASIRLAQRSDRDLWSPEIADGIAMARTMMTMAKMMGISTRRSLWSRQARLSHPHHT